MKKCILPPPIMSDPLFKPQVNLQTYLLNVYGLIKEGKSWDEVQKQMHSTVVFENKEGVREFNIDWTRSFLESGDVYLKGNISENEFYIRITEDPVNVTSLNRSPIGTQGKLTNLISYQVVDADPHKFIPFVHEVNAQKAALYSYGDYLFLYVGMLDEGTENAVTMCIFGREVRVVSKVDLSLALEDFRDREYLEILKKHLLPENIEIPRNFFVFTNGPEFNRLFDSTYNLFDIASFFVHEFIDISKRSIKFWITYDPAKAIENLQKQTNHLASSRC